MAFTAVGGEGGNGTWKALKNGTYPRQGGTKEWAKRKGSLYNGYPSILIYVVGYTTPYSSLISLWNSS